MTKRRALETPTWRSLGVAAAQRG